MELTYTKHGDYYLPDLVAPESPAISKYGMLRRTFLREHRDGIYTGMLLTGKLNAHLEEIDQQANEMLDRLTRQYAAAEGVTEALKATNQMAWVQAMTSIQNRAEEVVLRELVYC